MSQTNFFKSGSSKKCCREYNISKKRNKYEQSGTVSCAGPQLFIGWQFSWRKSPQCQFLYATQVFCKTHSGILQKRKNFAQIKFS